MPRKTGYTTGLRRRKEPTQDGRQRREMARAAPVGPTVAGVLPHPSGQCQHAARLANTIAVLDKGVIIKEGTSPELKGCCGGDVLVQLSMTDRSHIYRAEEVLKDLGDGKMQLTPETGQLILPLSGGTYLLPEIIRRLDTNGIAVSDLSLRQPTLDDVFLALTGHSVEEDMAEPKNTNSELQAGSGKEKNND